MKGPTHAAGGHQSPAEGFLETDLPAQIPKRNQKSHKGPVDDKNILHAAIQLKRLKSLGWPRLADGGIKGK